MNQIVTANNTLGAKLLDQFATTQPDANIVFSPLSITLALLLAHAGAKGATALAISNALDMGETTPAEAAKATGVLMQQLTALDQQAAQRSSNFGEVEDTVWLRIANALFVNREIALKPAYAAAVSSEYAALIESLDFGAPTAAQRIDDWVSEQTRGKIRDIAGSLNRDVIAVLVNAVYFKAPWLNPFPEHATAEGNFTLLDGSGVRVPMMANTERQRYVRHAGYEIVSLPFGGGDQLELLIVLPAQGTSYTAVQHIVAQPDFFTNLQLRSAQLRLRVPRFRVECDTNLNAALIALGMGLAFDPYQADFSAIAAGEERVYISEVRHKTFLDVNEKGVEAAAATAIKMMRMSMAVEQPIEVTVDRPFFCAIRDGQSGALLFLGAITRP